MLKLDINLLWTVVNVLIMYALLRKFLFKPVQDVLDKRQKMVDDELANAQDAKTKAETMAHADNYQVIDLLHVTENGNNQYGRYVDAGIYQNSAMKESASAAVDMAVMPGQMEVTADITVEFSILPR